MARRIDILGAATLATAAWAISLLIVGVSLAVTLAVMAVRRG